MNKQVEALLATGGWALDDAQARHRKSPDTFTLPSETALAKLVPGTTAKLIFAVLDLADQVRDGVEPYTTHGEPQLVVRHERMWLWVERVDGDARIGVLMNQPVATHTRLVPGARVRFHTRDVIDLDLEPPVTMTSELEVMAQLGFPQLDEREVLKPEDAKRTPTIAPSQLEVCVSQHVKPQRPWAFARALVGGSLQPDVWPVYGVRTQPRPDRDDCGWTFWTGDADMEKAAEKNRFEVLPLTQLHARCPAVVPYLALPPGWAFVLGPDGYADVYEDE